MEPKLASKSVEVAGAEMEVSLPEKIRQQSDLNVLVSLKNTGRDNILWGQISEYRDVRLSINSTTGKAVALSNFGKQVIARNDRNVYKYQLTSLSPGKVHEWKMNISKLFQLTPGTYRLSASITVNVPNNGITLTVKDVEFEVSVE